MIKYDITIHDIELVEVNMVIEWLLRQNIKSLENITISNKVVSND